MSNFEFHFKSITFEKKIQNKILMKNENIKEKKQKNDTIIEF